MRCRYSSLRSGLSGKRVNMSLHNPSLKSFEQRMRILSSLSLGLFCFYFVLFGLFCVVCLDCCNEGLLALIGKDLGGRRGRRAQRSKIDRIIKRKWSSAWGLETSKVDIWWFKPRQWAEHCYGQNWGGAQEGARWARKTRSGACETLGKGECWKKSTYQRGASNEGFFSRNGVSIQTACWGGWCSSRFWA